MNKVLILAYDFPPYVSVGGLRPYSWCKFLHRYDVYPIVVTRQWGNKFGNHLDYIAPGYSGCVDYEETPQSTIIRVPFKPSIANSILLKYGAHKFKILRKLITAYYELFQFVLPIGSKRGIFRAADDFLKNNKVDCIIATGDPFVLFKYASELSHKYSIPWVADYRDPWIQDSSVRSRLYKRWLAMWERKILSGASLVTTVQPYFQKQIEENVSGKKFGIIYNGYDPEIINRVGEIKQSRNVLSIAFAGTIKDGDPIQSFFDVCNQLIIDDPTFAIRLNFYGVNKEKDLKTLINRDYQRLGQHTHFHPRMDNLELSKEMASNNVCLLFNYHSILGTKIFDYLAVRRKILLCYASEEAVSNSVGEADTERLSPQSAIIAATKSGVVVPDAERLRRVLLELNDELKANGLIGCPSIDIEKYSRVEQAQRLAEIVKGLSRQSKA